MGSLFRVNPSNEMANTVAIVIAYFDDGMKETANLKRDYVTDNIPLRDVISASLSW